MPGSLSYKRNDTLTMPFNFESDRLSFHPIKETELSCIHELLILPETDRFNALGIPTDLEHTRQMARGWIEQMQLEVVSSVTLSVRRLDNNEFIGLFGIKFSPAKYRLAEVWYKLHSKHWGQGFATEGVRRSLRMCFEELGIHRIEAGVATENVASIRVLEKAGFLREGMRRKSLPLVTGFSDSFSYAILKSDWET